MTGVGWCLVAATARLLDGREREAVLGDLQESGDTAGPALLGLFGLIARRETQRAKDWRPWLAAFGVALPGSLLLMGYSVAVSAAHDAVFIRQLLALAGGAWITGLAVGWLAGRALWLSVVACFAPCVFCLTRFHVRGMHPFSLFLFVLPAVLGVWQAQRRRTRKTISLAAALVFFSGAVPADAEPAASRLVDAQVQSKNFTNNKIGTSPVRKLVVYLPPGYDASAKRYPVIYFLPNASASYRSLFDEEGAQGMFDEAIATGLIRSFILVSTDMNTPLGPGWYVNSPVTGNWEDFAVQELAPYMDAHFKTLPYAKSRGIAGDHIGGHGAIRLGMKHPDVFSAVYGLHPVGTGSGVQPMNSRPDWNLLAQARSLSDVKTAGFSAIFLTIYQAHLPNTQKPPLYIDLAARREAGGLAVDAKLMERLRNSFFPEAMVPEFAENLKRLSGLKFDWGRSDALQDHVYSNQAFTHKLEEFGIAHEAEEYGGSGDTPWSKDGRVYRELLPFFQRSLAFDGPN